MSMRCKDGSELAAPSCALPSRCDASEGASSPHSAGSRWEAAASEAAALEAAASIAAAPCAFAGGNLLWALSGGLGAAGTGCVVGGGRALGLSEVPRWMAPAEPRATDACDESGGLHTSGCARAGGGGWSSGCGCALESRRTRMAEPTRRVGSSGANAADQSISPSVVDLSAPVRSARADDIGATSLRALARCGATCTAVWLKPPLGAGTPLRVTRARGAGSLAAACACCGAAGPLRCAATMPNMLGEEAALGALRRRSASAYAPTAHSSAQARQPCEAARARRRGRQSQGQHLKGDRTARYGGGARAGSRACGARARACGARWRWR